MKFININIRIKINNSSDINIQILTNEWYNNVQTNKNE